MPLHIQGFSAFSLNGLGLHNIALEFGSTVEGHTTMSAIASSPTQLTKQTRASPRTLHLMYYEISCVPVCLSSGTTLQVASQKCGSPWAIITRMKSTGLGRCNTQLGLNDVGWSSFEAIESIKSSTNCCLAVPEPAACRSRRSGVSHLSFPKTPLGVAGVKRLQLR